LKLYCDCFAAMVYCSRGCCCYACKNTEEDAAVVDERRAQVKQRNPIVRDLRL
jgi:hypothetical protein